MSSAFKISVTKMDFGAAEELTRKVYDTIIIGGGPAGMSDVYKRQDMDSILRLLRRRLADRLVRLVGWRITWVIRGYWVQTL
jgi:hypothetical protein